MADCLDALLAALEAGEALGMATLVGPDDLPVDFLGRRLLVHLDGTTVGSLGAGRLDAEIVELCRSTLLGPQAFRLVSLTLDPDVAEELDLGPGTTLKVFLETAQPPPTLLIVGAGHIALPLSRMGKELGFKVVVLDDREEFASRERFPEADEVTVGDFGEVLGRFPITSSTYVVLVTRGHLEDERALRQVIGSGAAYVGMIGSRRRVRAVFDRLVQEGVSHELIGRVRSPIGLEIGAETPEEIAVSILAEVIHARRRGGRHPSSMSLSSAGREGEHGEVEA